ncbi:MAG TPA: molecular chaperone HtpG [Anaerolineaceae bacterium]|nr:molecular chaperone HtpG [Anaerolineaceae bacterium]
MTSSDPNDKSQEFTFKAETRQLLDILIHSLYTEREVFLRELISNASDALTRMSFEMLTNRNVLDPEAELGIWIKADSTENTLTIHDTGIGMTQDEMVENLGTIAHSGAKAFLDVAQKDNAHISDIIGQFGVGFYSAFMVAESIRVISRSYQPESQAFAWSSDGSDTYTIEAAEKNERGTDVIIKLKSDASEFTQKPRLHEIIKKHSDFIPYPIYLEGQDGQVNLQTALWRQQPRQVEPQKYQDFYKQFTLDTEPPITYAHLVVDAPLQVYALLYIPASPEHNIFSPRKQDGLKLYARKVLIQEYCQTLLPEYLRYVQGVVDSEDIPLNVSRESVQSTRAMSQIKKLVTNKLIDSLKDLAQDKPDEYEKFWKNFGHSIREGIASVPEDYEMLLPLLRFHSMNSPQKWLSLDDYVQAMAGQDKIYYILGDDEHSIINSPHLEVFRHKGYDVLLMADPLDPFMLMRLDEYKKFKLANVSREDLKMPEKLEENQKTDENLPDEDINKIIGRFKTHLGNKVSDVRTTERLVESPARLVDKEGTLNPEMQRVYHLLNREFETPQKILEINPHHPIIKDFNHLNDDDALSDLVIDQIYEDALLSEGLHPDPASMINRIQQFIEVALNNRK